MRYHVVPTTGRYSSAERIEPHSSHLGASEAIAAAVEATDAWRSAMRRHGYASGGYRVVYDVRPSPTWQGMDLDSLPSVEVPVRDREAEEARAQLAEWRARRPFCQ